MTGPEEPAGRRGVRPLGPLGAGALSLVVYLALVVLPVLGVLIAPLAVVPVLAVRLGGRPPVLAWGWPALALATLAALSDHRAVLVLAGYLLLVALPATVAEGWERYGWSEARWAQVMAGAALAVTLALVAAAAWPDPPLEASARWMALAAAEAERVYGEMGVSRGDLRLALDWWQGAFAWGLPAAATAYVVAAAFWIRPRLPLLGLRVPAGPFEAYVHDEWVPAAFAAGGLGTLLLSGTPRWIAANVLGVALILCFVDGLAIIRAHLGRLVGRGWLVRWAVVLVAIQLPISLAVAALGLIEPFRRMRPAGHGRHEA